MSDLLEWLLKKENKQSCRLVGIFLLIPPIAYKWSPGLLVATLALMFLLGLILIAAGFLKRSNNE